MRKKSVPSVLVMSTLVLSLAPAAMANQKKEDLPRYKQVSVSLFRGGQPSLLGIRQLKLNGIKTIISFRNNRKVTAAEEAQAKDAGLDYVNIPLDGIHKPSAEQIKQFLAITGNEAQQPVFVHCEHGQDRTGVMCAIYREEANKWSAHDAYTEAVKNGFHERYVWLADSVYDYAESKHMEKSQRPIAVKVRDSLDRILSKLGSKDEKAPEVVASEDEDVDKMVASKT